MSETHNKLAKILRTQTEVLLSLEEKMNALTGKSGVIEKILNENTSKVDERLSELGLSRANSYDDIYNALTSDLISLEKKLLQIIGSADLEVVAKKAFELQSEDAAGGVGFFLKKEKAVEMLRQNPPQKILDHFGYSSVDELIEKEGLESVYSALRFIESSDWMNNVFINSYNSITINDFEERQVKIIVLDEKWLSTAEKFLQKKFHNVSHLKELGIIFIIPIKIDTDGELLRVFTLLLHYLNEVPFYSSLFRKFGKDPDFSDKLMSLLRGDVPGIERQETRDKGQVWMIIQRYLAKDDINDPRLAMPHINPEAEHWYKVQLALAKIPGFENLVHYDFVGDVFNENPSPSARHEQLASRLLSFDLIDLIISLVKKGEKKYEYHQQEALWNKIFVEYMGRDELNKLIEENIIRGFITL